MAPSTFGVRRQNATSDRGSAPVHNRSATRSHSGRRCDSLGRYLSDAFAHHATSILSTRSLKLIHSILNRSLRNAQARDKVKRNVVGLCDIPTGKDGRPSKSLTFAHAQAILEAAEGSRMHAYVVLSRTLALPKRCVDALRRQRAQQAQEREVAGKRWQEYGLVFASKVGTPLDPSHVRRDFRNAIKGAEGVNPEEWTPRELRHSFVSLLSDGGLPLEEISRLVGHSSTAVTEAVYRKQIRPVLQGGAVIMDRLFES